MTGLQRVPWWFWVVLLGSLAGNAYCLWKHYQEGKAQNTHHQERMAPHTNRVELLRAFPADSGAIVFLGDSHIEGAPLPGLFPGLPVVGMGISGGTTEDVAGLTPEALGPSPAAVVVAVGINDFFNRTAPEKQLEAMSRLLGAVRRHHPSARLVVFGLMPTEDARLTPAIVALNKAIARLTSARGALFIDPLPQFLKNDRLDPVLTCDGLHLNHIGYLRWRDLIKASL